MVHLATVESWALFSFEWLKPVTGRVKTPLDFDSLTATDHRRSVRSRVIPCVFPILESQLNWLPDQGSLLNDGLVHLPHGCWGMKGRESVLE